MSRRRHARDIPAAGDILRRALIAWGLGHLALGDRRGVLLVALEVAAIAGLSAAWIAFGQSDRSPWVFVALVAFFAAWAWQAVDAYRRAVALGAKPGGAIQAALLAPVALALFSAFWVVSGSGGSPTAVLQRYVAAWRDDRPAVAAGLFATPRDASAVAADWRLAEASLRERLTELRARGAIDPSAVDPERPIEALVFEFPPGLAADPPDPAVTRAAIEFVRRETVASSFFGLFPTASQRTVVVDGLGVITLRAVPQAGSWPSGAVVWRVQSVDLDVRTGD